MQSHGQIIGGSTVLISDGAKRTLVPGQKDVVVILQVKDCLELIVNGRDKHKLSAAESRGFSVRGNASRVHMDRSVSLPIPGLQAGAAPAPSASARERLAHARQKSGALGAVLAQQMVTQEFLKDPFLIGVAELLHRLGRHFGIDLTRPRKPRIPSDLSKMIEEAAKALEFQMFVKPLPAAQAQQERIPELPEESLEKLLQGLLLTLNRLAQSMRSGAQPELDPLASQLLEALRRLIFETPLRPSLAPGQWPAEAKKPVPGMDSKTMMMLCDSWNQALTEDDGAALAGLINNDASLSVLTAGEKAAVIDRMCGRLLDPAKRESIESGGMLLLRVLQAAASPDEFRALAGDRARRAMLAEAPPVAIEFNLTAGAFDSPPLAPNAAAAAMATRARSEGCTAAQILAARAEITGSRMQADDVERLVQDPLKMILSANEEKIAMIRELMKGQMTPRTGRAIVSILEFAEGKVEFDELVKSFNFAEIAKTMPDAEAAARLNLLSGAHVPQGLLASPESLRKQQQEWEAATAAETAAREEHSDPLKQFVQNRIDDFKNRLRTNIRKCDRRSLVDAVLLNAERRKEGKAPINPVSWRLSVHSVLWEEIPEKEKKRRIEEFRKKEGYSEYAARNILFSMTFLFSAVLHEAEAFAETITGILEERMAREGARNGPESQGVELWQMKLDRVASLMDPFTYTLSRAVSILEALYPPPKEWFEKD